MQPSTIFDSLKTTITTEHDVAILNDNEMEEFRQSLPKRVGMVNLPGINDKEYQEYIDKVNAKPIQTNNLWLQLP
jgi:hypothetical protein